MSRPRSGHPTATRLAVPVEPPETVVVEKVVAGGAGFARRASGEPVFIRRTLPGDSVQLESLVTRKGYSEADGFRVVSASTERRAPPCVFAARCGGCDLMAFPEQLQREVKHGLMVEVLRRTAHLDGTRDGATPLEWDRGPQHTSNLGYRSRIRLHIDRDGRLGFLAEGSHELVAVDECLIATERANQVLKELVALARLSPGLFGAFEQVEVRALSTVVDMVWYPRTGKRRDGSSHTKTLTLVADHLAQTGLQASHHVVAEDAPRRWREFVQAVALETEPTKGRKPTSLWFAPGTFTQVNWDVNLRLIAHLVGLAREHGCKRFLDLYCGAGNFSLPLLAAGLEGTGIESNPTSIAAATAAAHHQQLGGTFLAEDVKRGVERLCREKRQYDLIVIDPPRAGFKDTAPLLKELAPRYLFVCACDPVTFARDLKCLTGAGFEVLQLRAFDMFPQTHHVECTAWLAAPTV